MNKKNKGYLIFILVLFITFVFKISYVNAKVDFSSLASFDNMPNSYFHTLLLLGILFANLVLGLMLGDNIVVNFNRIIKKEKITRSLMIEVGILLLIGIPLAILDVQTFSLCVKALAASLLFGPILDSYQTNKDKDKEEYNKDLSNNDISKVDISLYGEYLKEYVFNSYKEVQESFMYADYDKLKQCVSDNLFKEYSKDIKKLSDKNKKRIIKNITFAKANVLKIDIKKDIENIDIYLNITKRDYISDLKKKKIVKGSKNKFYNIEYLITLSRNIEEIKCVHCGAPIDVTKEKKCEYCNEKISKQDNKFLITRKQYISKKTFKKDNVSNEAKEK